MSDSDSDEGYIDISAKDILDFVNDDSKKFTHKEIFDELQQRSYDNYLLHDLMHHVISSGRNTEKTKKLVNLLLDAGFSPDMPEWSNIIDIGVAFKERELRKKELERLLPTFNRAGRNVDVIIQEYDMTFRKNRKKSR